MSLHWPPGCWSPSSSSCPKADWKGYLGHRTELTSNALAYGDVVEVGPGSRKECKMPTVAKGTTLNADSDNALEVRDPTTSYGRPDKEVLTVILYLLEEGEFRPDMRRS
jgi:hypothetical protein